MGLIGPIRGTGSLPHGQCRHRGAHPPLFGVPHLFLGFSPTWEVKGGWHPSLAYIRRGRGALLIIIF